MYRFGFVPVGSPKMELPGWVYVENGGTIDTDTWHYYLGIEGTLTGLDEWAGAELVLGRRGPAFQVGLGANGRNRDYGGSTWITWDTVFQPGQGPTLPQEGVGDVNVGLGRNCP